MWFLNNVWHYIIEKHSEINLYIVGKWNKEQIKQLLQFNNVSFKGFVPSLQDEYDGAIVIVPILRGSGLRMKILDAVNYGSPFIATTIGAFDMKFLDNRDCYIADEPVEFANKLLELIEHADIRERFYNNSAKIVEKYYSIDHLTDKRFKYYLSLLNQR